MELFQRFCDWRREVRFDRFFWPAFVGGAISYTLYHLPQPPHRSITWWIGMPIFALCLATSVVATAFVVYLLLHAPVGYMLIMTQGVRPWLFGVSSIGVGLVIVLSHDSSTGYSFGWNCVASGFVVLPILGYVIHFLPTRPERKLSEPAELTAIFLGAD